MSETTHCRARLAPFCVGCGVDLGCGYDKIKPEAFGFDKPNPYTRVGHDLLQLQGDARDLSIFKDGVLDYVYSSHLLEDFIETEEILREWVRVVRPGGNIVLYLPDQQRYEARCKAANYPPNAAHKIPNFNLQYIKDIAAKIGGLTVIHELDTPASYSFDIVLNKD